MLKYEPSLDAWFAALADPTRRTIVDRLSRGPASVSELAHPLAMSLPAVVQHVQVLEGSGLVSTEKVGRVRMCRLEADALGEVERWLHERRLFWQRRLDRLGAVLAADPETPAPVSPAPARPEEKP